MLGRAIPTQGVTPGRSGSPRAVGGRDVAGLFHGGGRSGRGRAVAGALYFFARWLQLRSEILLSRSRRRRADPGACYVMALGVHEPRRRFSKGVAGHPWVQKSIRKHRFFLVSGRQRAFHVGNLIPCTSGLGSGPCLTTCDFRSPKKHRDSLGILDLFSSGSWFLLNQPSRKSRCLA